MMVITFFVVMAIFTGMAAASTVIAEAYGAADSIPGTWSGAYEITDNLQYNGAISNTYQANINAPSGSFPDEDMYKATSVTVGSKYELAMPSGQRSSSIEMWSYDGNYDFVGKITKDQISGPYAIGDDPLYVKLTRGNLNTYYGYQFAVAKA